MVLEGDIFGKELAMAAPATWGATVYCDIGDDMFSVCITLRGKGTTHA